ncbi:hypothetical protein PP583_gp21 [Pseudoalteromonas phage HS6]|nr:hypothetical protein PP583_gp21 [Pseudoalteromonas phage HS6]
MLSMDLELSWLAVRRFGNLQWG